MVERERSMNVFWEEWLGDFEKNRIIEIFSKLIFENPMMVAEVYMFQTERDLRRSPLNWLSVLTAARKPLE
jgi:hypothetical protein